MQKFIAREKHEFSNGAIGWRSGGPRDCLGPFAKVNNCPIDGTNVRLTCYATNHADTFFSVPAATRYKGKAVKGYFTMYDEGCVFVPFTRFSHVFNP
jgi:hypothetical protein